MLQVSATLWGSLQVALDVFCMVGWLPYAGSLCHKDSWLPCTERSYYRPPYAIKNQRGASSKAPSRGLWMPELVLYCIRVLVKQFLGTVLDIEVDQSDYYLFTSIVFLTSYLTC